MTNDARWTGWRKATASGNQGGNCVEVARSGSDMGVRDSKDKTGPVLRFSADDWSVFLKLVR